VFIEIGHKHRITKLSIIVLILGAKTETESQFINMFCAFSNFDDYGIIVASSGEKKCNGRKINEHKSKNIYIFSQEWFKIGKINPTNHHFNESITKQQKFKSLFEKRKIDLYFDEIHKGGTTDRSENILKAFHNANVTISIFVMVTATFAKPNIRYNSTEFIDKYKKSNKIIEWGYEDQQMMKKMETETSRQLMVNTKKKYRENTNNDMQEDTTESTELQKVFDQYKELYGADSYLSIIAKEYENHPELVMVSPQVKIETTVDTRTCFIKNLKCDACKTVQTLSDLQDPANIFNDVSRVSDLLKYIAGTHIGEGDHVIDPKSVYSYLQTIGAPTNSVRPHTELWFLPDKDLYSDDESCRRNKICEVIETEENQDDDVNKKTGLPNIEPLTRGLAFLLMDNRFFREKYNVLIVHNTNSEYKKSDGKTAWKSDDIFKPQYNIKTTVNSTNLSNDIKQFEIDTFKSGKSLIVLTGAKLRLGISLPCADVAFNFDDIKSIDNNYQTMFRVLTERYNRPKKYGYYVDFNMNRSKTFLYEYNVIYGTGKNKRGIQKRTEALQSLMFMFNYNGLGLEQLDTGSQLSIYNELIDKLKLTPGEYQMYLADNNVIKTILKKSISVDNISTYILKQLKSCISIQRANQKPKKQKEQHTMVEGTPLIQTHVETNKQEMPEDESTEPKDDISLLIDNLVEVLPAIVSLLAFFSDNKHYKCDSDELDKCIRNAIANISELDDTICNCEQKDILVCYLNNIETNNYDKSKMILLLQTIYDMLTDTTYTQLNVALNNIFADIKETMTKEDGLILSMDSSGIQQKIQQYLQVRSEEKDKFGEVFTPGDLIDDMLNKIPAAVWRDPSLKWLDPANGTGNFPMKVYEKLLEKLPDSYDGPAGKYSDEKGKKQHILKNMLYMVELNPRNVKIARKIFGAKANICCANFLEEEAKWKRQFGVEKFDVIVGNPPYQSGSVRAKTTKKIKHDKEALGDAKTLWPDFVKNSLELLRDSNSYLLFIHPASWIGFKSANGEMFKTKQIVFLRFYSSVNAHKLFGSESGEIPLTYYLLKNVGTQHDTTIYDNATNTNETFNIYENNFVPTESISMWNKILKITQKNGSLKDNYSSVKGSTDLNEKFTTKYKHPVLSIINKDIHTEYSELNNNKNNEKKLLLANSSMGYPIYDYFGIMYPKSTDQCILYSNDNERELKQLQNYLLTNLLFYLINIVKTRQKFFDNKIFEVIPNITKITNRIDIDDTFLIDLFKLNRSDLVGYEKYIASGEGRLDKKTIDTIKHFKLDIPREVVDEIKEEKQNETNANKSESSSPKSTEQPEPKTNRRKKGSSEPKRKTRKPRKKPGLLGGRSITNKTRKFIYSIF